MAAAAKHTPGPWAATTRRGSWDWLVYSESALELEICQPFHDGTEFNEVGEANARLIAAAPELLAALKIVERDRLNCNGRVLELHAPIIRAAIAKAEGGAA